MAKQDKNIKALPSINGPFASFSLSQVAPATFSSVSNIRLAPNNPNSNQKLIQKKNSLQNKQTEQKTIQINECKQCVK